MENGWKIVGSDPSQYFRFPMLYQHGPVPCSAIGQNISNLAWSAATLELRSPLDLEASGGFQAKGP